MASVAPVSGIDAVEVAGAAQAASTRLNVKRIGKIRKVSARDVSSRFIFISPPNKVGSKNQKLYR
jgi:hypothetical protein